MINSDSNLENTLEDLFDKSLKIIEEKYPNAVVGIDCNLDYGQLFISLTDEKNIQHKHVIYGFTESDVNWGDWDISDLCSEDDELNQLWKSIWQPFEDSISSWMLDLTDFEWKYKKNRLLEFISKILNNGRSKFPVLVIDHDEYFPDALNRMQANYKEQSSQLDNLTSGYYCSDQNEDFMNYLALFNNGTFINNIFMNETDDEIETEGNWKFNGSLLSMQTTHANIDLDDVLFKWFEFEIVELSKKQLIYKDDEDQWQFIKKY